MKLKLTFVHTSSTFISNFSFTRSASLPPEAFSLRTFLLQNVYGCQENFYWIRFLSTSYVKKNIIQAIRIPSMHVSKYTLRNIQRNNSNWLQSDTKRKRTLPNSDSHNYVSWSNQIISIPYIIGIDRYHLPHPPIPKLPKIQLRLKD